MEDKSVKMNPVKKNASFLIGKSQISGKNGVVLVPTFGISDRLSVCRQNTAELRLNFARKFRSFPKTAPVNFRHGSWSRWLFTFNKLCMCKQ